MRNLDLTEMESIEGGKCEDRIEEASFAVSGSGLIFSIAAVAAVSNPIGWAVLGLAAVGVGLSAYACSD